MIGQEIAAEREAQHAGAHAPTDENAHRQNALAMFDQRRAQSGGERVADPLRGEREADREFGAGKQIDISRHEGRSGYKAETGLSEKSVGEIGGVVAFEILLDLGVISLFRRQSPIGVIRSRGTRPDVHPRPPTAAILFLPGWLALL